MTEPPINPVPFWFLRHGETDWNARMLSQGRVDIPLNKVGLAQAERAADALVGKGITAIFSSTLSRARVTAETVAARLNLPIQFDPELQECAFGVQEGQEMSAWFDDWIAGISTPQGAEPFADLRIRTLTAINRATSSGPGPVLVVAHGALWRAFRQAAGLEANVRTPNALPLWVTPPDEARGWHFTPAELPG
ncbi:histidine phosphatase family protein [Muricoccus radiodurans]|uniref:histidine phosphatase family protein n=1 Tax=Muricoccus radiodurans TaxID=2231721 RepID=UPI003CECA17E